MTHRPLVLVVDEAADVLARSPEARALMTELLLTGRKNSVQDPEPGPGRWPLPNWQYPTLAELEAAARQQ